MPADIPTPKEEVSESKIEVGSIDDVVSRLTLWARRAPKGLALVEYDSEYSLRAAIERLERNLAQLHIEIQAISLPVRQPAVDVLRFWLGELQQNEGKAHVVSVQGLTTSFATDKEPLPDSLRLLNFNRENLARFPVCQIWWVTRAFAEDLIRATPDLYSWFLVRLSLTEQVENSPNGQIWSNKFEDAPVSIEEARLFSKHATARLETSIESGLDESELMPIAVATVAKFLQAKSRKNAERQARGLAKKILSPAKDVSVVNDKADVILKRAESLVKDLKEVAPINIANIASYAVYQDARKAIEEEKYVEAESLLRRVLGSIEPVLGSQHLEIILIIDILAALLMMQGRFEEAIPLLERSLSVTKTILGETHPNTASHMSSLAVAFVKNESLGEAEFLLHKAIAIYERNPDKHHSRLELSLNILAGVLDMTGRKAEAEELRTRAQAIHNKAALEEAESITAIEEGESNDID